MLHISNCLLMSKDVWSGLKTNFAPEGRRYWMLEEPDTWKEVLILYQSKVSTAVGNISLNFVQTSTKLLLKRVNTWNRCSF